MFHIPISHLRLHKKAKYQGTADHLPRTGTRGIRIISWNLLRLNGATVFDVSQLIKQENPDLLLMQEATRDIDDLPELAGGYYSRNPLPDRIHGLACWSATPFLSPPLPCQLQRGALIKRIAQIINQDTFTIANVHLSHGQLLNRRQLLRLSHILPPHAAILGDFNAVGPVFLPGFEDVGPKSSTHNLIDLVPIRLDRCLVRGLYCRGTQVIDTYTSDHKPIAVNLFCYEKITET